MAVPGIRQVTRIDIFISSPGDLEEERQIVRRVLEKLNRGPLREQYYFYSLLFEDEVPPEIGKNAQEIVNRYMQVQNSYILVSMFWTRMGTPFTIIDTKERYESGTQYEFLKGYENYQKTNHPHILLYRKKKANPQADPDQRDRVESFFNNFIGDPPKLKGLFAPYTEPAEFEKKVEAHIVKIINAHPPQPESGNQVDAPVFKEEPRRIDAAIPGETAVNESTPVQAMICLPDSKGLQAFLPEEAGKNEIKKRDVRAGGLTVAFPVDKKTGKIRPARVKIELAGDDFRLDENSARVDLAVGADSGQISFVVIPLKPSPKSILLVRVKGTALDGCEIEFGSVVLSTKIREAKEQISKKIWNLVSGSLGSRAGRRPKRSLEVSPPRVGSGLMVINGIGTANASRLRAAGVRSPARLLKLGTTTAGRRDLAVRSGVNERRILRWVNHADMFRIRGVGAGYIDLLSKANVDSVTELARHKPENLLSKLREINSQKKLVRKMPTLSQVESWVVQARELPSKVFYFTGETKEFHGRAFSSSNPNSRNLNRQTASTSIRARQRKEK